jgi:hypothetical protein
MCLESPTQGPAGGSCGGVGSRRLEEPPSISLLRRLARCPFVSSRPKAPWNVCLVGMCTCCVALIILPPTWRGLYSSGAGGFRGKRKARTRDSKT